MPGTTPDTSALDVYLKEESTYATAPTASYQKLRLTSENIKPNYSTTKSEEMRSDRAVIDIVRTDYTVAGSTNHELSFGSLDAANANIFEAVALSAGVSTPSAVTGSMVFSFSTNNIITYATGGFTAAGATPGAWVVVTGATLETQHTGIFKVAQGSTNTVLNLIGFSLFTSETDTATVTPLPQYVGASTIHSFAMQKDFTDLTNVVDEVVGLVPESMNISTARDGIIQVAVEWIGSKFTSPAPTAIASTPVAANTTSVLNAVEDVLGIVHDNNAVPQTTPTKATAFNLTFKNNFRTLGQIGTLGVVDVGVGKIDVSGSIDLYFSTQSEWDDFLAFDDRGLAIACKKGTGYIVFDSPRGVWTDGERVGGGQDQDIIVRFQYEGKLDATESAMFRIATGTVTP